MQIVIISGMSGAGKSYALQALEDGGYYCIDNLPLQLTEQLLQTPYIQSLTHLAIGIDIRGGRQNLREIPATLEHIRKTHPTTRLIYLYANQHTLQRRYNETRRRHPLAEEEKDLVKAIHLERQLLEQLSRLADWRIDTSATNIYELGQLLRSRLSSQESHNFSIIFQSFGFKHQAPYDSDFVFDVRNLPNPYWVPELREFSGRDPEIIHWLEQHERVHKLCHATRDFLELWMEDIQDNQRAYLTISIGCTGGRHRSVYIAEQLYHYFSQKYPKQVMIRHRELNYINSQ